MIHLLPTLFTAHGSPMNALGGTLFSTFLANWAQNFPRPRAILCISAHYETDMLTLTSVQKPDTIYDFYGFPDALYRISYPAPGSPDIAIEIQENLTSGGFVVNIDTRRGIDHGVWSPLRFLYPEADIPIIQLSIARKMSTESYLEIGKILTPLRGQGILIIGSGNLVHNLAQVSFHDRDAPVPEWATHFDATVKKWILERDEKALTNPWTSSPEGRISHPSLEHYIPLLFVLGAGGGQGQISFPFEGFEHGSISMRSVRFE